MIECLEVQKNGGWKPIRSTTKAIIEFDYNYFLSLIPLYSSLEPLYNVKNRSTLFRTFLLKEIIIFVSKENKDMNTPSNMLALGTKAPFFELPNPSKTNELQSLEELKGEKGTLVIFMCNHCPFVLHVIDKLNELYEDYNDKGIEFIAINANDIEKYPADSPEKMIEFQIDRRFDFPYLFDESQAVAKAYDAACTPDFYFFDDKLDLVYRGQMDDSRPGNNKDVTGEDLIIAFENLLAGEPQEEIQRPSMGCNIKWK